MIDFKEISEQSPKAWNKLKEWTTKKLAQMQNLMTQNSEGMQIDELPEITDEIITGTLFWNIRSLYDFFDANRVYINIIGPGKDGWLSSLEESKYYRTRQESEEEGFKKAFKQLEKICLQKNK